MDINSQEFKKDLKDKLAELVRLTEDFNIIKKKKMLITDEIKKIMTTSNLKTLEIKDYKITFVSFKKQKPINSEKLMELFYNKIVEKSKDDNEAKEILKSVRDTIEEHKDDDVTNIQTIRLSNNK